jgi:Flp pilus assembly protein CpaB
MKTRLIGAIVAVVLAVLGTVVLTGYVRGADARASAGAEMVSVYVVTEAIPAGTKAEEAKEMIGVKKMPRLATVPGRVTDLDDLTGTVSGVALLPGEQLLNDRWVDPDDRAEREGVALPDGMQEVSIALPVEHVVGGTIKAGDTVGIVISATVKPPGGIEVSLTEQVFHKVLVLAVQKGASTPPGDDTSASSDDTFDTVMITLARPTDDIQKIVWGQEFGSVWLTIEPEDADERGSRPVDAGAVFG